MFQAVPPPIIRSTHKCTTASGVCQNFTATCRYRGCVGTKIVSRFGRSVQTCIPDGHLRRVTYIRYRTDAIDSPDDEHMAARNV